MSVTGRDRCPGGPTAVVAIPVRNEAERIGHCLHALAAQTGVGRNVLGIVLALNNCNDGTSEVVESILPGLGVPVRVVVRDHADANAGWARREAMEAAATWLDEASSEGGTILTTDADTLVPPDWVARNLAVIAAGADGVAGRVALDESEAGRLPSALHARGRLEAAYEALLVELEALIDPLAHDPWPRHWTTSGATLAVRLGTYRRVGGMPPIALGEDKAFVASLLSSDAIVRHDPFIVVTTSGRLDGRATGGAADTMRRRCEEPDAPCDDRLEALPRALFRFGWRRRLRRLHAARLLGQHLLWAPWLGLPREAAREIAALPVFGAVFATVEALSPCLTPRPLVPAALPVNIARAKTARAALRGLAALREAVRSTAIASPRPGRSRPAQGAGT